MTSVSFNKLTFSICFIGFSICEAQKGKVVSVQTHCLSSHLLTGTCWILLNVQKHTTSFIPWGFYSLLGKATSLQLPLLGEKERDLLGGELPALPCLVWHHWLYKGYCLKKSLIVMGSTLLYYFIYIPVLLGLATFSPAGRQGSISEYCR